MLVRAAVPVDLREPHRPLTRERCLGTEYGDIARGYHFEPSATLTRNMTTSAPDAKRAREEIRDDV